MFTAKLEVKNLACTRGSKNLFRNLSFSLAAGECLLVKGPNGSGKSTLLKILAGFTSYQKGSVQWLNDRSNQSPQPVLSYLGHKDALRKLLTPYENLLSQLKMNDVKPERARIEFVLREFEIAAYAQLPCTLLSAGQNRKVSLAAIVLAQKMIWILDEPFSSLDKRSSDMLSHWMRQQLQNNGIIIMASHFLEIDLPHKMIDLGS